MPRTGRGVAADAGRFGVPQALAELRRHGVIGAGDVRQVPLRVYRDTAVVALDRGAGPELVVKVDEPAMLSAVARFHGAYRDLPLVPALRHVDPAHWFIAYDWAAGELGRGMDPPPDKAETLLAVANGLLCHYVPAGSADAFWLHELHGPEAAAARPVAGYFGSQRGRALAVLQAAAGVPVTPRRWRTGGARGARTRSAPPR
jgi:hypothetical protein